MNDDDRTDRIIGLKEPSGKLCLIIRGNETRCRIRRKNIGRDIRKFFLIDTHQVVCRRCGQNDDTDRCGCKYTENKRDTNDQA